MRSSKAFPFQHIAGGLIACFCLFCSRRKGKKNRSMRVSWAILTSGWPRPSDLASSKARRSWRRVVAGPGSAAVASCACTGAAGRCLGLSAFVS